MDDRPLLAYFKLVAWVDELLPNAATLFLYTTRLEVELTAGAKVPLEDEGSLIQDTVPPLPLHTFSENLMDMFDGEIITEFISSASRRRAEPLLAALKLKLIAPAPSPKVLVLE